MQTDEALKILNIEKPDLTSLLVETKYKKFYETNDPNKGGSFYLQSKIYRAKEALLEDIPKMSSILTYHVVAGEVMAADVMTMDG